MGLGTTCGAIRTGFILQDDRKQMSISLSPGNIGIAAIAVHEPPWRLDNGWFGASMPRKFVRHTGIKSRCIAAEGEVAMAVRAAESLQRELKCDLRDCVGIVFASPSLVPAAVAQKYLDDTPDPREDPDYVARQFADRLGLDVDHVQGINWFCSGYTKALALVLDDILPQIELQPHQFLLVATASRISRITDYACSQTAPLFGDLATLTVLARADSQKYPVRFVVRGASAEMTRADSVLFDFHCRQNVLAPARDGGRIHDPRRLVFSLDGMGIADAAPRAMAQATAELLHNTATRPQDVRFVVPHQAGSSIVRFTAMKLESVGVHGDVINGLTSEVGNVSSCSIPYALKRAWHDLNGTIACPSAGVGSPGEAQVSQGCLLLQAVQCGSV